MSIQELSQSLVGDVKSVLEGKKLDPVGKADADIDNDGDTDSSDEYLKKRRAAISKAMKDEGNAFTQALASAKDNGEKEFVVSGKKYTVKEVEEMEPDKKKKEIKELDKEKMKKDMKESLLPLIQEYGVDLVSEVLDSVKKFESLAEAGPLGSLGIRQDFERDSNKDARIDSWKKKQAAMKPIDRMKKKLEDMRTQRQRHDDAAEKYRDAASEQREKAQGKDSATAGRMKEYANSQDEKADRQEEMADDLNFKIQDLKDDIAKMTDKAKDITKRD